MTSIGDYAFYGCSALKSITIPKSVTSIGKHAFACCNSFESIVVEEGNTAYDSREGCNAIIEKSTNRLIAGCNNTIIPNNIKGIESYAFSGCDKIEKIIIPSDVTSIEAYTFYGCSSLKNVTIPQNLKSIGDYAFSGCESLDNIHCWLLLIFRVFVQSVAEDHP